MKLTSRSFVGIYVQNFQRGPTMRPNSVRGCLLPAKLRRDQPSYPLLQGCSTSIYIQVRLVRKSSQSVSAYLPRFLTVSGGWETSACMSRLSIRTTCFARLHASSREILQIIQDAKLQSSLAICRQSNNIVISGAPESQRKCNVQLLIMRVSVSDSTTLHVSLDLRQWRRTENLVCH